MGALNRDERWQTVVSWKIGRSTLCLFRDMRFYIYHWRLRSGIIHGRKRIGYDGMRIIFRILDRGAVKIDNDFVLSGSYPLFFID